MTIVSSKNGTWIIAIVFAVMTTTSMAVCSASIKGLDCGLVWSVQDPEEKKQDPDKSKQDQADGKNSDTTDSKEGDPTGETKKPELPKPFIVRVADESIEFTVTGTWKQVPKKSGFLEAEIAIPKKDNDQQDGRLTISGAGGTIEANVVRWKDQFLPEGSDPLEVKRETKTINNQKVHLVDMAGTYLDAPGGQFSGQPKIERKNYRMLAAIVETKSRGNYFLKFYGPKNTIDQNEDFFKEMVESLKVEE